MKCIRCLLSFNIIDNTISCIRNVNWPDFLIFGTCKTIFLPAFFVSVTYGLRWHNFLRFLKFSHLRQYFVILRLAFARIFPITLFWFSLLSSDRDPLPSKFSFLTLHCFLYTLSCNTFLDPDGLILLVVVVSFCSTGRWGSCLLSFLVLFF